MASLGAGGYLVVWEDTRKGSARDVYSRIVDGSGTPTGTVVSLVTSGKEQGWPLAGTLAGSCLTRMAYKPVSPPPLPIRRTAYALRAGCSPYRNTRRSVAPLDDLPHLCQTGPGNLNGPRLLIRLVE